MTNDSDSESLDSQIFSNSFTVDANSPKKQANTTAKKVSFAINPSEPVSKKDYTNIELSSEYEDNDDEDSEEKCPLMLIMNFICLIVVAIIISALMFIIYRFIKNLKNS